MNLHELVSRLIIDTKGAGGGLLNIAADSSVAVFAPELILCVAIVLMLFVRLFDFGRYIDGFWFALFGSIAALVIATPWVTLSGYGPSAGDASSVTRMEIFTGMLVFDRFTLFIRTALLLFLVLFTLLCRLTGIPDREDSPDIYTLVMGATLGMCLMASANHLIMVFTAVEMASVPSYVLAGLAKGRRRASEAALKYAVYGAGAAGVMLYGISLVSGLLHTAHIPTMTEQLIAAFSTEMAAADKMVLAMGGLMITVGLAYKLSAVPFHFWAPDVFEGATAEVNAFLSVASKTAALALLVRLAIGFSAPPLEDSPTPGQRTSRSQDEIVAVLEDIQKDEAAGPTMLAATTTSTSGDNALFNVSDETVKEASASDGNSDHSEDPLAGVRTFAAGLIAFLAAITCTFGNLAAYGQTNIKRLLAYSTVAHAGYMMMAVPAMLVMLEFNKQGAQDAVAALLIYIAVYLFMNLGAFAIVAFLRNGLRSEEISDYAGLVKRCPMIVVCFALIMFSLIGMPPLSGFVGKFAIFASLANGYTISLEAGAPSNILLALLIVGGVNTAISLFYYLKVVKVMTIDPEPENRPYFDFNDCSLQGAYVWMVTIPTAVLIVCWGILHTWATEAARYLFLA